MSLLTLLLLALDRLDIHLLPLLLRYLPQKLLLPHCYFPQWNPRSGLGWFLAPSSGISSERNANRKNNMMEAINLFSSLVRLVSRVSSTYRQCSSLHPIRSFLE